MWVIIAKKGLDKHRDDLISDILDVEKDDTPEIYLKKKNGYGKYLTTSLLQESLMYKQEASCKRLVKRFESSRKINTVPRWDKFYNMKDYHISYRYVSKEEWISMCDDEIRRLTHLYNFHKGELEKKKNFYK